MSTKTNQRLFGGPFRLKPTVPDALPGDDAPPAEGATLTEGVPLARLIKRELIPASDLVMLTDPRSVGAERFRRLRTVLVNRPEPTAVIAIGSGRPEEGKSIVAMNLALAFADEREERTLIIDADLRRPTVGRRLHPAPQLGLREVVQGKTSLDHALLDLENSSLKVLPAGGVVSQPAELLSSDAMKDLIATLREQFERVIIDTPPLLPFTDADVIGGATDGILMVARAGITAVSAYEQAVAMITSTRIIGTVLNDVSFSLADVDRYHRYSDRYYRRGE